MNLLPTKQNTNRIISHVLSALGVSHIIRYINAQYLLTYLLQQRIFKLILTTSRRKFSLVNFTRFQKCKFTVNCRCC